MKAAAPAVALGALLVAAAVGAQRSPSMEEVPTAFTTGDRPSHVRFTVTNRGAAPLRVSGFELRYHGATMPGLDVTVEDTGRRAPPSLAPGQRVTLIAFFNSASLPRQWSYDFTLSARLDGRREAISLRVRRMIRHPLRR